MVYPAWVSLFLFFFSAIFAESSEPMGLKFGPDAWIGPEGDNKDFHRDSFYSFLMKNQKPQQLGISHCTLLARLVWVYRKLHSFGILSPISINFFSNLLRMRAATLKYVTSSR